MLCCGRSIFGPPTKQLLLHQKIRDEPGINLRERSYADQTAVPVIVAEDPINIFVCHELAVFWFYRLAAIFIAFVIKEAAVEREEFQNAH